MFNQLGESSKTKTIRSIPLIRQSLPSSVLILFLVCLGMTVANFVRVYASHKNYSPCEIVTIDDQFDKLICGY